MKSLFSLWNQQLIVVISSLIVVVFDSLYAGIWDNSCLFWLIKPCRSMQFLNGSTPCIHLSHLAAAVTKLNSGNCALTPHSVYLLREGTAAVSIMTVCHTLVSLMWTIHALIWYLETINVNSTKNMNCLVLNYTHCCPWQDNDMTFQSMLKKIVWLQCKCLHLYFSINPWSVNTIGRLSHLIDAVRFLSLLDAQFLHCLLCCLRLHSWRRYKWVFDSLWLLSVLLLVHCACIHCLDSAEMSLSGFWTSLYADNTYMTATSLPSCEVEIDRLHSVAAVVF